MNGCVYRTEDNKCEFWSDYGKGIVSYCDFDDCEEKKPSNADRIRAMSDEELEKWLVNFCSATCGGASRARVAMHRDELLDWLKEEAERGE